MIRGFVVSVLMIAIGGDAVRTRPQGAMPADLIREFEQAPYFDGQLVAAQKMVRAGDKAVLRQLEPWLTRSDRHARGNAAFVFAALGDDRGLETLLAILVDKSFRTLDPAYMRGNMSRASPEAQSDEAIWMDRYYAVHLLGLLRDPRAVSDLIAALADSRINDKAAWALGEIADARAVPALVAALSDPKPRMRASAIVALDQLRATEAIVPIQALLGDLAIGNRVPVAETARRTIAHLSRQGDVPRLLLPADFNNLAIDVQQALHQRNCEIPQPWETGGPRNLVRGHFMSSTATDLAVLCSVDGSSTILVFRDERAVEVLELARQPDDGYFQTIDGRGTRGYSRQITTVPQSSLAGLSGFTAIVAAPAHDAISDAFNEKGETIWYWTGGAWVRHARDE